MCAYQMTRVAQLLHYYTSLSQALFSKPLSPIGPTQPSRGECDQENSPLNLPRWTPCLFLFFFIFFLLKFFSFGLFPFILSHVVHSLLSLSRILQYCLSLALCLYLLFWFVVLIIVQPPHPPLSFRYSCSLCVIEFCPGCYGIPMGMCVTHGMLGGSLTLYSLVHYASL